MNITWELLKKVDETSHSGHYSKTRTVWGRGYSRRVPRWISDAVKSPRLAKLAEFVNNDPGLKRKGITARTYNTTIRKGRQMSSGVYYSWGDYPGTVFIASKGAEKVFEHNSAETYRRNVEVVRWILDQRRSK